MKKTVLMLLALALMITCLSSAVFATESKELVVTQGAYTLRNDFPGFVGGTIQVGEKDISVTSLGRMIYKGNTGSHEIKLVNALDDKDVPGAVATVDTSKGTEGEFLYAPLAEPVTLLAGQKYYILSNEESGGDMWAEFTNYSTTEDAAFCGTAFFLSGGYNPGNQEMGSFVGLSIEYIKLDTATAPPPTEPPVVIDPPPAKEPYVPGQTIETNLITGFEYDCVKPESFMGAPEGFAGDIGNIINTGNYPLTVTALGRLAYEGNSGEHTLKLVHAATGEEVEGSSATVNMTGSTAGNFVYGDLAAPITLEPNSTYYLLSSEDVAVDSMGNNHENMFTAHGAVVSGYVYHTGSAYETLLFPNSGYVTLDMKFSYTPDIEIPGDTEETELFLEIKPGALRNDYHSYIGIKFVTGAEPLLVTHLGRIYLAGNVQQHDLKLVDAETNLDVPNGSITVYGGTPDEVTYVALDVPVMLEANHMYYLMSREYAEGDKWYNNDAKYLVNYDDDCTMLGGCYLLFGYENAIMLDQGFTGVNLKYQKAVKEQTPPDTQPEPTEPAGTQPAPTEPGAEQPASEFPVGAVVAVVAVLVVAAVVIPVIVKKKKAQ